MSLAVAEDDCSLDGAASRSCKIVRVTTSKGAVDAARHSGLACGKGLENIEFSTTSSVLPARA